MPRRNAVLLPEGVDLTAAAFLEPLTVGLHAIRLQDFLPGRAVAVTGVGTIGLLLLQSLRQLGAGSITALDVEESRLKEARSLGADRTFDSREEGVEQRAAEGMGDAGFEFVFETAGVPAAEILALKLAGPRARVMFVGTPHVPLTLQPAEFELINRKELMVQGVRRRAFGQRTGAHRGAHRPGAAARASRRDPGPSAEAGGAQGKAPARLLGGLIRGKGGTERLDRQQKG
jgi:threonine dehydrogenase-like Zn-dependent dehydrogenase